MIPVRSGGFTIPVRREPQIKIQSRNGNAGNGGRPNTPTILPQYPGSFPRVNLNPKFRIGAYNNAEESFHFPRFNHYWKNQFNTNNPINPKGWSYTNGPKIGGSGNGNNGSLTYQSGAGYKTSGWGKYSLGQLGVLSGISQSYPYNKNSTTVEGSLNRVWTNGDNLNIGDQTQVLPGVIQIDPTQLSQLGGVVKGSVISAKQKGGKIKKEML